MNKITKSPKDDEKAGRPTVTAIHEGELKLTEDAEPLKVAVLEDGTRLIGHNAFLKAFGRSIRGRATYENRAQNNLPSFADAKNLRPFLSDELYKNLTTPIRCRTIGGGRRQHFITGYKAETLPLLCDAYLDADAKGALHSRQKQLAAAALVVVRALSKIGIIALIDEATGYQHEREKDELQKILRAYIAQELLPWQKRFPDTFYKELFRLNGWDYTLSGIKKRPGVIGTWTTKLIYEQLPPGVLDELKAKTPKSEAGNYTARFFQSLTPDTGNPHLTAQIQQIVTLFQLSDNMKHMWQQFEKLRIRQLGQLELPFQFDEKGHTKEPPPPPPKPTGFDITLMTALNYNPKSQEQK